ncbi:MAG TPA: beta-ketoacyl reductase, partial [Pseudonocardiaceae bacterium]|nr:beta-ketoacyl reductase [Pseudonocardiaceae bacterium]
ADVTVAACDVADRDALAELLGGVAPEHPLRAVVHAAGVGDNVALAGLTGERLDAVLSPKVAGAWHLHELTRELDLSAFVLLSSCAGLTLGAGQANYGAANRFLDALAAHRHAEGLPATALAFGLWRLETGLGGGVTDADLEHMSRLGMPALSTAEGLVLFDEGVELADPVVVAARVDAAGLPPDLPPDAIAPLLRTVLRPRPAVPPRTGQPPGAVPLPAQAPAQSLAQRMAGLTPDERRRLLADLVRVHVAAIRHDEPASVDFGKGFIDLGLDSLAAIELRNRLETATGTRLAATVMFDHPTPTAMVEHLLAEILPDEPEPVGPDSVGPDSVGPDDESIRRMIHSIPVERIRAAGLLDALTQLATADPAPGEPGGGEGRADEIRNMDLDDLVRAALADVPDA